MEQKKTYTVKVALGCAMSDKAYENEEWFKTVEPNGNEIVEKTFHTIEEANAFVSGIELMNGWLDECHIILSNDKYELTN